MKNRKKGFSLVELVIIIAIVAILIAVLAPSLMTYTERSRSQKDATTMDEVVNAVQLAMADQKCYDEMIKYSCSNNFITYKKSIGKLICRYFFILSYQFIHSPKSAKGTKICAPSASLHP